MFHKLIREIQSEMGYRHGILEEDTTWIRNPHDHSAIRRVRQSNVKSILWRLQRKWGTE